MQPERVAIVGAGIGGLTLALNLTAPASPAASTRRRRESEPLGVGINILPHATAELAGSASRTRWRRSR